MDIVYKEIEFKPFNEVCSNRHEVLSLVGNFDCGDPTVNSFLKNYYCAYYNHILGMATTNLMIYKGELIGYFTSRCTSFKVNAEESKKIGGELETPAIELAYIAVDQKYQKLGIGEYVIKVLIGQAIALNKTFACRYFFLRSLPDKINYYSDPEVFQFEVVGIDEDGLCLMKHYIPDFYDFSEFEGQLDSLMDDDEGIAFFKELDGE